MRRYLLFMGDDCYPLGGIRDFKGSFDSIDSILKEIENENKPSDWIHIFDSKTGNIIKIESL